MYGLWGMILRNPLTVIGVGAGITWSLVHCWL